MSLNVNNVVLMGYAGRDGEYKPDLGSGVLNFTVATTESWKDKGSGAWKEKTEWTRVAAWGKLAERLEGKILRGDLVYVEGKLKSRSWVAKDGTKKYMTEVQSFKVLPLGRRGQPLQEDEPTAMTDDLPNDIQFP